MNATDHELPIAAMILGEVASTGPARGRALLCDCAKQTVVPRRQVSEAVTRTGIERFDAAVSAAEGKPLEVQASVRRNLAHAALGETRNLRIVPRCSYVARFIKPNSEFVDLVEPEVAP